MSDESGDLSGALGVPNLESAVKRGRRNSFVVGTEAHEAHTRIVALHCARLSTLSE